MTSLRPARSTAARLTAVGATVGLASLTLSAPAMAHVSVNPTTAEQGSYAKLTFRVPVESETASTTKVQVAFPAEHPFASVRTKPVPGWTARVQRTNPAAGSDSAPDKAVSQIVWTADSAATALKPGEFGEFDISLGPLPEAESLTFKAVQTYSDGTVSRWIEAPADGTEAEHPAPVLSLTPSTGADHHGASAAHGASAPDHADHASTDHTDATEADDSKAPLILSIIAVVVAALGAGVSVLRRR